MTWKLILTANYQHSNESHLTMTHLKSKAVLRQWFGPMAQQLFKLAHSEPEKPTSINSELGKLIDKQAAQHFLIEASFYHQKCLLQYQVTADLERKQFTETHELSELLLYMRMTCQHPSLDSLHKFANCHLPFNLDLSPVINKLVEARLIQQIEFLHFVFYDKNPYPHDHVFDCYSHCLRDVNDIDLSNKNQTTIKLPTDT